MSSSSARRRSARAALALTTPVIAALLFTGCGNNDAPSVSAPSDDTATSAPATPESTGGATTPSSPETTATQSPTTTQDSPTQDGTKIAGQNKKFEVTMPSGWRDLFSKFKDTKGIQLVIAAGSPSAGKLTNINVVAVDAPGTDTDAAAKSTAKKYRAKGETVKMLPSRTIAGETANGYSKVDKAKTQSQTQWFFNHGGEIYIVTLTNGPDDSAAAGKSFDNVLASWSWT